MEKLKLEATIRKCSRNELFLEIRKILKRFLKHKQNVDMLRSYVGVLQYN